MRAWNDVRRVVLAQFRPQRAGAGQGPGDLPLAFLPRLTPKRQHRSRGPVTTVLLYSRHLAEEDAVPHKLVMTRQVRDWLYAVRSGDRSRGGSSQRRSTISSMSARRSAGRITWGGDERAA